MNISLPTAPKIHWGEKQAAPTAPADGWTLEITVPADLIYRRVYAFAQHSLTGPWGNVDLYLDDDSLPGVWLYSTVAGGRRGFVMAGGGGSGGNEASPRPENAYLFSGTNSNTTPFVCAPLNFTLAVTKIGLRVVSPQLLTGQLDVGIACLSSNVPQL